MGFLDIFVLTGAVLQLLFSILHAIYSVFARAARSVYDTYIALMTGTITVAGVFDRTLLQRWLMALGALVALAFVLVAGYYAVHNTGFFMIGMDTSWQCVFARIWEFFDKTVIFHWKVLYEFATDALNNAFQFIGIQGSESGSAFGAIISCFEGTGNFQYWFDIGLAGWKLIGAIPFAFVSAPRQIRTEPIIQGQWGYHYPLVNNQPVSVPRFEFNPAYAAQGPAEPPSGGYPNAPYALRSFWISGARLWEDFGKLFFGIVAKLSRPTEQFMPSLYLDSTTEDSLWRETADFTCRGTEFFIYYSFLWPFETSDGRQIERDLATQYACLAYRVVAAALQAASLTVNDALTLNRPLPSSPDTCHALPPTAAGNIERFLRGFPVVDFFLPPVETNLNIFRSNIVFCKFMVDIQGQNCLGIATGSLSYSPGPPVELCPEWPGNLIPLPEERINYIGYFVNPIIKLASIFANKDRDPLLEEQIEGGGRLAIRWLNFVIDDPIFVLNAVAQPIGCSLGTTLGVWFGKHLTENAIASIEYAYSDSCALAIVNEEARDNLFLCFIALASRADPDSFWNGMCDLVDGLSFFDSSLELNCVARRRKRDLGEPQRPPGSRELVLTYFQRYKLWAPFYAHETREASHAFQYCLFDPATSYMVAPRCNSTCSTRPCLDRALDCVQERLIATGQHKNGWIQSLARDSYWRTAGRASALATDAWFGCEDGDVELLFRTVNATVDILRDMSARVAASSVVHAAAHEQCGDAADWSNSTVYLQCIQLKPLGETWEETLALHEIEDNTMCGAMLHHRGIQLRKPVRTGQSTVDSAYEGCLTMLAFGATALASGGVPVEVKLSSYLNGWTAMHSVTRSTANLQPVANWNEHPRNVSWWRDVFLTDGSAGNGTRIVINETSPAEKLAADREARINAITSARVSKLFHDATSMAYAYFNYLADSYAKVILSDTEGHEKDAIDKALFMDHVGAVAVAIGTESARVVAARREFTQKVYAAAYPQTSHTVYASAGAFRAAHDNATKIDPRAVGIAEVATIFGSSLLWVDRLYADATNAARDLSAERSGFIDAVGEGGFEDDPSRDISRGSLLEMRLSQNFAGDRAGRGAVVHGTKLGFRAPRHWAVTTTLAAHYQAQTKTVPADEMSQLVGSASSQGFAEVDLRSIVVTLDHFVQTAQANNNTRARVQAAQAASKALRVLDERVTALSMAGSRLDTVVGKTMMVTARVAVRLLWNLASLMLRPKAMSAVQSAHVLIDLVTNGDAGASSSNLREWLAGERGYIVGLGYVDIDSYDYYMHQEALTRNIVSNGFFGATSQEQRNAVGFATAARRRLLDRSRALRASYRRTKDGNVVRALPGDTIYGRFLQRQRQRIRRRLTYGKRAKFLVDHGLGDDEHQHIVIPAESEHYEAAQRAAEHRNGTADDRRTLTLVVATASNTNTFLFDVGDAILGYTLGYDTVLTDNRNALLDQVQIWAEDLFTDIAVDIRTAYDELVIQGTCLGEDDYRLGGFGSYKFGCLPFLPERLMTFYMHYPSPLPPGPLPYDGSLNVFQGPGYLVWPAAMIRTPCATPKTGLQPPAQTTALTLFNHPYAYVAGFTLSDECPVPGVSTPGYPLCNIFCDYCEQEYYSAAEAGFESGWDNISAWSAAWRAFVRNTASASGAGGFYFVIVMVILVEFVAIIPGTGSLGSLAVLLLIIFGETFIRQTPERAVFPFLFLMVLRAFGRGAMWLALAAYVVNLWPIVVLGAAQPLYGDFLVTASQYTSADYLLVQLFIGLRAISVPLFQRWYDVDTVFAVLDSELSARLAVGALTTADFYYSIFSTYNFIELMFVLGVVLLLIIVVSIPVVLVLAVTVDVVTSLLLIGSACLSCITTCRLCCLRNTVEENTEAIESLQADIDALTDRKNK